jgi:beta-aspartyl-peptidase (threonine type)
MPLSMIVHGGAWDIPEGLVEAHESGCKAALLEGWSTLQAGGHALDAVEVAIREMEDNPDLNAGTGSVLNSEGKVQLDASIMEGDELHAGAVAAVETIKNPISLARLVLQSENVLLVAEGAVQFARAAGMDECRNEDLVVERELRLWEAWQREQGIDGQGASNGPGADTVGAVAMDRESNVATGDSTGGKSFKHPGRVGDSPLIGCGVYADNQVGGAACTGWGESIIRVALAKTALDLLGEGKPVKEAAQLAVQSLIDRVDGRGGVIMIDATGSVGYAFNTAALACAYLREDMKEPVAGVVRLGNRTLRTI